MWHMGSPAADTLPVLAMLDAEVRLYSATEGTCRDIPVDTFITGRDRPCCVPANT